MSRRILAVTSGRADATPMAPVIDALSERVCVGRAVELGDEPVDWGADSALGRIVDSAVEELEGCRPDIVLLLGDRYETLAAALAATVARVPIAHIHGGEASFGSFDNQIRDAVTKLSHVHFVAAEQMRERLLALGEEPHRIHVTGAPGLDNLFDLPERRPKKYFMVTYHPATLSDDADLDAMIEALGRFPHYHVIWTYPNADPGAARVNERLEDAFDGGTLYSPKAYLKAARNAAAIVGNSSSGLIEAPTLGVPTVNVGPRQDGRLKGPSVFDCQESADAIEMGIAQALVYKGPFDNPYGGPGASSKIAKVLSEIDLDGILVKRWAA